VKNPGSQVGCPAADEEGGEVGGEERDKSNSLAIETSAPPPVDK